MGRIDDLKTIRKQIIVSTHDTKKRIFTYIMTQETTHYTLTCNKILVNLSKLQDKTLQGIKNILDTDELRLHIDIKI